MMLREFGGISVESALGGFIINGSMVVGIQRHRFLFILQSCVTVPTLQDIPNSDAYPFNAASLSKPLFSLPSRAIFLSFTSRGSKTACRPHPPDPA